LASAAHAPEAAACVTVNECPAMVADALRAAPVFWVQETVVVPEPLPDDGLSLSHAAELEAVQLPPIQPEGEPVTVTACEQVAPIAEGGPTSASVKPAPMKWIVPERYSKLESTDLTAKVAAAGDQFKFECKSK
jgi:hypothetical protein